MKKTLLAVALMCGTFTAASADDILDGGIFNHLGVGVGVGTTGIDIEVSAPITNYVQVRAGVAIMPKFSVNTSISMPGDVQNAWSGSTAKLQGLESSKLTKNGQPLTTEEQAAIETMKSPLPSSVDAEGKLSNTQFKLLFDVYPVPKWSFHLTAGFFVGKSDIISVYNTNCFDQLRAMDTYNNSLSGQTLSYPGHADITLEKINYQVQFENKKITPKNGQISAALAVNSFKPYLGIGFGRAVPKKTRLCFACDMGVQFWGSPELKVNDDILTKDDISSDFLDIMHKITVYPVLNFRLCGRIL